MGSIIIKIIIGLAALFIGAHDIQTAIESYKEKAYYSMGLSIMLVIYWASLLFWLANAVMSA